MATATIPERQSSRPIPLRMRQDLEFRAQRVGGKAYWCVKDPVSLEYFHLKDEEFRILKMLDGRIDVAEVLSQFHRLFAPIRITAQQLQGFLEKLLLNGLVVSDRPQTDAGLLARSHERQRRERRRRFTNLLAIRFRGIDPDRFLGWIHGEIGGLLRPRFFVLGVMLMIAAVIVAVVRFDQLRQSIPLLTEFLTIENMAVLAVALAVVKIFHEFAHGIACKHYGGECHEMGILLLVFTPCLYCDVSDAWMLPSKWRRIAISAAGIYAELLVASLCTFIWATSQPGFLHTLCLNVMLVASVNTLFFNGNFLRRYDGYYIFSDWIEVPNLAQRAQTLLRQTLGRVLFGIEGDEAPEEKRGLLLTYAVTSTLYLWFLIGAILWFCHRVLKPHGLGALADLLMVSTVLGLVLPAVTIAAYVARTPAARTGIRKGRALLTATILVAIIALIAFFPAPFTVDAIATLQPADAKRVYAVAAGTIFEAIEPGSQVAKDAVIARLENPELNREVARLQGELKTTQRQLANLEARLLDDPSAAGQLPATRELKKDIEQQLVRRLRDQEQLTLRAPTAGTVLSPPYRPERASGSDDLSTWSGYPLDARNRGCYLEQGTLVCLIGSPDQLESILLIDESEIPFVVAGQDVKVQFDELPGKTFPATVTDISADNLTIAPPELAFGNKIAVRSDETGKTKLLENTYQVRATFTSVTPDLLRLRTTGRAKIAGPNQTLGSRLHRYLRRTFGMQW